MADSLPPSTPHKAVVALLTGLAATIALFIPAITDHVTPELIGAVATVIGTALVYFVPNRPLQ